MVLEMRFYLIWKLIPWPLAHIARKQSTYWRRRGGDSLVVFYQSLLPTPPPTGFPFFISPEPAITQKRACLSLGTGGRCWHPGTVLWYLSTAFHPFSWGWHFCPLHISARNKRAASGRWGSCIWEAFAAFLKHEKKKNQVPTLQEEEFFAGMKRIRCSCSLHGHLCSCWVGSRCICLCVVLHCFSAYVLSGGLPSCQCFTKSACHYFIFWNPKMLKCFYDKQNVFNNCSRIWKSKLVVSIFIFSAGCLPFIIYFSFSVV